MFFRFEPKKTEFPRNLSEFPRNSDGISSQLRKIFTV